jgi:uncharacterized protein
MMMPNHLANETSPYLLQHAHNPVDWRPWGAAALNLAQQLNKPILLSIGYSTCHWCHVMAAESFEDAETASILNQHFVNIKVDREERPDLDQIYQNAHAMLTGQHGGWPLTLFLAPDQTPFFSGTYFPKTPRYGLPAFKDLLLRISAFFHQHAAEIQQQNASLLGILQDALPRQPFHGDLAQYPISAARDWLEKVFDDVHGGFGPAPKFPKPVDLAFCLRRYESGNDLKALSMAQFSLRKICDGGIFDQIGGGFFRYSVDERWLIPHFEKMLYDNALLLGVLADVWRLGADERLRTVAEQTVAWLCDGMRAPDGGFYSALDADSMHEEGKFYIWDAQQVAELLDATAYAVLAAHYGLDGGANFEGQYWHCHVAVPLETVAGNLGISLEKAREILAQARAKLFSVRALRPKPERDDKLLTSWNALMVKGLAHAGRIFGKPEWIALSRQALQFIHATLWQDGMLYASHKDGKTHLAAYLDDYAFLLDALLELLQSDFHGEDLTFAGELADALLEHFEDKDDGGFYFTSRSHEKLICRIKSGTDSVLPAGNAVAAFALQRLGHLRGEMRYIAAAERALRLFYPAIVREPLNHVAFLAALEEYLSPPSILVLRGPREKLAGWQDALSRTESSLRLAIMLPNGVAELPGSLAKPESAEVQAWLCQGSECLPPVTCPEALCLVRPQFAH